MVVCEGLERLGVEGPSRRNAKGVSLCEPDASRSKNAELAARFVVVTVELIGITGDTVSGGDEELALMIGSPFSSCETAGRQRSRVNVNLSLRTTVDRDVEEAGTLDDDERTGLPLLASKAAPLAAFNATDRMREVGNNLWVKNGWHSAASGVSRRAGSYSKRPAINVTRLRSRVPSTDDNALSLRTLARAAASADESVLDALSADIVGSVIFADDAVTGSLRGRKSSAYSA